jgi:hypothetical protein
LKGERWLIFAPAPAQHTRHSNFVSFAEYPGGDNGTMPSIASRPMEDRLRDSVDELKQLSISTPPQDGVINNKGHIPISIGAGIESNQKLIYYTEETVVSRLVTTRQRDEELPQAKALEANLNPTSQEAEPTATIDDRTTVRPPLASGNHSAPAKVPVVQGNRLSIADAPHPVQARQAGLELQAVQQARSSQQVQLGPEFVVVRASTHHSGLLNRLEKAVPILHRSKTFYRASNLDVDPNDQETFNTLQVVIKHMLDYTSGKVSDETLEFMMGGVVGGPSEPTVVIRCGNRRRKRKLTRKLKLRTDLPSRFRFKILIEPPVLGSLGVGTSSASAEEAHSLVEFRVIRVGEWSVGSRVLTTTQWRGWAGLCGQVGRAKYGRWIEKNSTPIYEFSGKNSGLFTIGGVLLIRNKLYALTTAHAFVAKKSLKKAKGASQKGEGKSEKNEPAELVNPLRKNTEIWTTGTRNLLLCGRGSS